MNTEKELSVQDVRDLYFCALLSRHVYPHGGGNDLERELDLADVGIIETKAFGSSETGTFGTVYVAEETVFIVLRGTESILTLSGLRDWLTNILGFKWRFYGIRAHFGFGTAAVSVLDEIETAIDLYRDRRIVFSGHSLGGALAALISVAIVRKFRESCRTIGELSLLTFGQPRVTTRRLLDLALLGMKYIRVQNGSDAVSGLPPPILYGHAGLNLYFPNDEERLGFVVVNPGYFVRLRDRLFTFWERLTDHGVSDFVRKARVLLAYRDPEFINELAKRRAKILTRG